MPAGERNKWLVLEKPIRVRNSLNENVIQWEESQGFWCSLNPISSSETIRAKQAQLTLTHKIKVLYTPEITSDCRFRYDVEGGEPRYFGITGMINVGERNRELEITAQEVRNG